MRHTVGLLTLVLAALPAGAWRVLERGPHFRGLRSEVLHEHPVFSFRRIEASGPPR